MNIKKNNWHLLLIESTFENKPIYKMWWWPCVLWSYIVLISCWAIQVPVIVFNKLNKGREQGLMWPVKLLVSSISYFGVYMVIGNAWLSWLLSPLAMYLVLGLILGFVWCFDSEARYEMNSSFNKHFIKRGKDTLINYI